VRRTVAVLALACLAGASSALGHENVALPPLDFEPPAPGTYVLHRIMAVPDGEVLDLEGRLHRLRPLVSKRITLLGLIYTTCVDPDGCPFALRVFDALEPVLATTPRFRDAVQLVTLSFDPEHDTPAAMRGYAGRRARPRGAGVPWHFLTTRSPRALAPVLDGLGQDVRSTAGAPTPGRPRELSHVLKVFLVDRAGFVREIYSSAFLHPRTVLNDIDTLLMAP
jgi:protein SCO1/2